MYLAQLVVEMEVIRVRMKMMVRLTIGAQRLEVRYGAQGGAGEGGGQHEERPGAEVGRLGAEDLTSTVTAGVPLAAVGALGQNCELQSGREQHALLAFVMQINS